MEGLRAEARVSSPFLPGRYSFAPRSNSGRNGLFSPGNIRVAVRLFSGRNGLFSPGRYSFAFRLFSVQPRNALSRARKVMHSLVELLAVTDPRARLVATLERLDAAITQARARVRCWNGSPYPDPDSHALVKLEEMAQTLVREYHAARASSVADIGAQDRQAAIAELRAVLAVWEDPSVSDEQWLASRGLGTKQPAQLAVVRRKRAGSGAP